MFVGPCVYRPHCLSIPGIPGYSDDPRMFMGTSVHEAHCLSIPGFSGYSDNSRMFLGPCVYRPPLSEYPRNHRILGRSQDVPRTTSARTTIMSEYPRNPGILRHKRPCTGGPRNILGLSEYPGKTGILRQWGLYMCTHGPRNILGSSNYPGILGILFQGHQTFCRATWHAWPMAVLCGLGVSLSCVCKWTIRLVSILTNFLFCRLLCDTFVCISLRQ